MPARTVVFSGRVQNPNPGTVTYEIRLTVQGLDAFDAPLGPPTETVRGPIVVGAGAMSAIQTVGSPAWVVTPGQQLRATARLDAVSPAQAGVATVSMVPIYVEPQTAALPFEDGQGFAVQEV